MSTSIDNRVVGLQFDNKNFEKNVDSTLQSLDKLETSLQFKGAQKGFSDLEKAASNCDISCIAKAAEVIQSRFSTLGIVGMTVLSNIANKAVETGERVIQALAIQPITQGYSEYELKMGSIQTIMASTGASLETVNGYLNELNTYSDRTIYSFSDMTQNIGKFTNAGVKLEDAVKAIQGISNEAAISGANAQQASHAMYNFAQALSAGSVKLIDWKSIENANMATVEFKNQLIKTATELGTLRKEGDQYVSTTTNINGKVSEAFTATKFFNESLSHQWMTTDVLITTLGKYANELDPIGKKAFAAAQDVKTFSQFMDTAKEAVGSGWAETWEIIFGNFEESKTLWTNMSEFLGGIISKSSDARNNFLSAIFDSPWEKLTKKIRETGIKTDDFNNSLMELARDRGVDIDKLLEDGKELADLVSEGVIGGDLITETINKFANSLPGASDATENATEKLVNFKEVVDDVIAGKYGSGEDRVKALTEAGYEYAEVQDLVNRTIWGETVEYEKLSEVQLESMGYTDEQIAAIKELAEEANTAGTSVDELIKNMQRPSGAKLIWDTILNTFKGVHSVISSITTAWKNIFSINPSYVYKAIDYVHGLSEAFKENTKDMSKVTKLFSNLFKVIHTVISKVANAVKSVFTKMVDLFPDIDFDIMSLVDHAGDMLATFNDWLSSGAKVTDSMKAFAQSIRQIIMAIPGMDRIVTKFDEMKLAVQSMFGKDNLTNGVNKFNDHLQFISESFDSLWEAITSFDLNSWKDNTEKTLSDFASSMQEKFGKLKTSIGNLFAYIRDTLDLDIGNIAGFTTLLAVGYGLFKLIDLVKAIGKAASEIGGFVKNIRKSFGTISKSITKFIKSLSWVFKAEAFKLAAFGLIELSTAIAILAGAMWVVSQIPNDDLWESAGVILSLVAVLSMITFATAKFAGKEGLFSIAAVVGSVVLLVAAIKMLSADDMTWTVGQLLYLGEAILAVWALTEITTKIDKSGKDMLMSAISIAAISGALVVLAYAMKAISLLDLSKMLENTGSLIILFGSMIALMAIVRLAGRNAAKAGVGMLAIVGAIYLLIPLLFGLSKISKSTVSKASSRLLSIFSVFGVLLLATRMAGSSAHKAAAVILAMSLALLPITGIVYVLGSLDAETCWQGVGAISVITLIFSILVAASGNARGSLPVVIAMSATMVALGLIIGALSLMNPASVLSSAIALSSVILALTLMMAIITNNKTTWAEIAKTGGQLLLMVGTLEIITLIITQLSSIKNPETAIQMAGIAEKLLYQLLIVLGVCTLVGLAGPSALLGLASLAAVINYFLAILVTLGAIDKYVFDLDSLINEGIPILEAVGEGIGRFVGGIISGISEAMMDTLLKMAALFQVFCATISVAANSLDIPDNFGDTIGSIASAILQLSAADLLTGISNFLHINGFDGLPEHMTALGNGVHALFESIKDIDESDLKKVEVAANAGAMIAGMASEIPNSGGFLGWLVGDNDMGAFADQFEAFGTGIVALSNSAAGVNVDNIELISKAGKIVADMASEIPNMGGKLAELIGDNTMSDFAEDFEGFGDSLALLSKSGANVNVDNVKVVKDAGIMLSTMADTIPNTGGRIAEFFGDNDMSTFGSQFQSFAEALVILSNKGKKVSLAGIAIVQSAANSLVTIVTEATELNTDALTKLPDSINTFIENMNSAFSSGEHMNYEAIKMAGKAIVVELSNGVTENTNILTQSIKDMYQKINGVVDQYDGAYTSGQNFAKGFANGIDNTAWYPIASARRMGKNTKDALNAELDEHSPSRESNKSGKYFAMGFANGIRQYAHLASSASKDLGNESLSEMSEAMSRVNDIVNHNPNLQPVIKPVVDMSNVDRSFNGLSATYNKRQILGIETSHRINQNARYNRNADTISALKQLGNELKNISGTSYSINGLNVTADTEVADAVRTLVRATRMGRRS